MSNVWYNKYRPQDFDQVIGQELAVRVLSNAIKTNKIKNGYLLTGSRGVGKTTIARIFANSLNDIKSNPDASIDIFEMDAASNTSVDDVRLLIENASTPPLVGNYKVFIIDEVHMLSKSAMNALLKILEEPPVYLVFVLATTNPEKILPTVLSRLIKLDLSDHTPQELIQNLTYIAKEESIAIDKASLELIAKKANGGQRDAINYLQTVAEYNLEEYNPSTVGAIIGVMPDKVFSAFVTSVKSSNSNPEYKKSVVSNLNKLQITPLNLINQTLSNLLDAHFEGDSTNSDLIDILADYSSKNLPITNVTEVMSYLDFKYTNKSDIKLIEIESIVSPLKSKATTELKESTYTQKKTETIIQISELPHIDNTKPEITEVIVQKSETNIDNIVTELVEIEETSDTTDLENDQLADLDSLLSDFEFESTPETETEVHTTIETPSVAVLAPEINSSDFDLDAINRIMSNLKKNKKSPITLTQSLEVLSVAIVDNKPKLISTDKKRTAIITDSDIEFLNEIIESLLGSPIKIEWDGVAPKPKVAVPTVNNPITPNSSTSQNSTHQPVTDSANHFYSVYGSRPEGVPEDVPSITSPIPIPSNKNVSSDADDELEGGIHDLFDI